MISSALTRTGAHEAVFLESFSTGKQFEHVGVLVEVCDSHLSFLTTLDGAACEPYFQRCRNFSQGPFAGSGNLLSFYFLY